MMDTVKEEALAYIAAHHVMTLATTGPAGLWAAAVFYVNKEFTFYFLSAGHTRHAQNIEAQPRTAVTIQEDYADWETIQGIQLEGIVTRLSGQARQTAMAHYHAKFPFLAQAPAPLQQALLKVNWYKLVTDRLYFIDNGKGFGHRDEIRFS
ncbi:MAG: pyridoxamine 5'-phosphate oxidase family protein [Chloroflexota bacterium]